MNLLNTFIVPKMPQLRHISYMQRFLFKQKRRRNVIVPLFYIKIVFKIKFFTDFLIATSQRITRAQAKVKEVCGDAKRNTATLLFPSPCCQ